MPTPKNIQMGPLNNDLREFLMAEQKVGKLDANLAGLDLIV
jgi:hypothetical protein